MSLLNLTLFHDCQCQNKSQRNKNNCFLTDLSGMYVLIGFQDIVIKSSNLVLNH